VAGSNIFLNFPYMKKDLSSTELADIIDEASPSHPIKKWLVYSAIVTILITAIWYFFLQPEKQTGPTYSEETVTRGNIELSVTATGSLAPTNQVTVGSELSGTISAVHVDTNNLVKKGDPLAELDTSKLIQQTLNDYKNLIDLVVEKLHHARL
jgi:HlyD family secretion protein